MSFAAIYDVTKAEEFWEDIGDFRGLTSKLDYLAGPRRECPLAPALLSVALAQTTATTLPTTQGVHPAYGTLQDFRIFSARPTIAACEVVTELVFNHTSDEHPWFRRPHRQAGQPLARLLRLEHDAGSLQDARIIFRDFEPSNWTWDPWRRPITGIASTGINPT